MISDRWKALLASAYELSEDNVAEDAFQLGQWTGSDGDLLTALEDRHGWSRASELASYYLAALRLALA